MEDFLGLILLILAVIGIASFMSGGSKNNSQCKDDCCNYKPNKSEDDK